MKVDVTLVPVSVRFETGAPQFVALQTDGMCARATVTRSARQAVDALVHELTAEFQPAIKAREITPRKVTFRESGDDIDLVYSFALPIPLGDLDVPGTEWIPLLEPARPHIDARNLGSKAINDRFEYAETMLEWWKEFLEEKAGVLAFLPEHFTARQMRDIYSAIWGYEQDVDSFASWSGVGPGKAPGVLTNWVQPEGLTEGDLADPLAHWMKLMSQKAGDGELAGVVAQAASAGTVGLDPTTDSDVVRLVEPSALFSTAAMVGYQRRARGPKPQWFRQPSVGRDAGRTLVNLYTPRPTWQYAPKD